MLTEPPLAHQSQPFGGPYRWTPLSDLICRDSGPKKLRAWPLPASMTKLHRLPVLGQKKPEAGEVQVDTKDQHRGGVRSISERWPS